MHQHGRMPAVALSLAAKPLCGCVRWKASSRPAASEITWLATAYLAKLTVFACFALRIIIQKLFGLHTVAADPVFAARDVSCRPAWLAAHAFRNPWAASIEEGIKHVNIPPHHGVCVCVSQFGVTQQGLQPTDAYPCRGIMSLTNPKTLYTKIGPNVSNDRMAYECGRAT